MIERANRDRVIQEMPTAKAEEKQERSRRGIGYSVFGGLFAFVGVGLAVLFLSGGGAITMWPVVLIGGIVGMGILLVFYGGHLTSRELSSAFWDDLSVTIVKVWRRNGGGQP